MTHVRGLPLPALLLELPATGQWRHPGEDELRTIMPWFEDPLDFLTNVDQISRESRSLDWMAEDAVTAELFRQARGSLSTSPVELPWLDADQAVLIAVNRNPGDDVAVALDYRSSRSDPQVVASDFWTEPHQCAWRIIAPAFSAFTAAANLTGQPMATDAAGMSDVRAVVAERGPTSPSAGD